MKSDRDQSIDRLLRALPRSGGGTSHDDSCPDAETLAALADHTLGSAVRREIETHVADCDRCQMLTAALARSQRLAGVPTADAARVQSWRRRAVNWFVPAAAAATAIALWVMVPGQRNAVVPASPELDREIAALPPVPAPNAPTDAPRQAAVGALRDQSATTSADAGADLAVPVTETPSSPSDLLRDRVVGEPVLKAEEALSATAESARDDAGRRENETSVQERVSVTAPGRSAASAPPASPAVLQERVAGFEVASSTSQIRWRVGPGAVVQYSADGGMTWAAQQTGPAAELTAGSSPSPDVCWLVGRGGVVLRTTDGGRQWERASLPETVDIIAVTASNALNAVVNAADGRRFQTTDGGRTWAPVQ